MVVMMSRCAGCFPVYPTDRQKTWYRLSYATSLARRNSTVTAGRPASR